MILEDDKWYNGGPTSVDTQTYNKGDRIIVDYELVKNAAGTESKQVRSVKLASGNSAPIIPKPNKDLQIARAVALKAAVTIETDQTKVIKTAMVFTHYLTTGEGIEFTDGNKLKEENI